MLGYGFRPHFPGAALWAALATLLWIAALAGLVGLPTAFAPVDWLVQSLLFGSCPQSSRVPADSRAELDEAFAGGGLVISRAGDGLGLDGAGGGGAGRAWLPRAARGGGSREIVVERTWRNQWP